MGIRTRLAQSRTHVRMTRSCGHPDMVGITLWASLHSGLFVPPLTLRPACVELLVLLMKMTSRALNP